jgi:hypothetical protein
MPAAIMVAAIVVSVASSVYSGMQASAQANAEEEQQRLNNKSTMEAAIASYGDLTPQERDIDAEAAQGGLKAQSEYLRSVGDMNLISGASGTYGGSVDSMLRDLKTTRGRNMSDVVANRSTELANVAAQAESIRYGARANMQTRIISKPTALGMGLDAAGAAASGASRGASLSSAYTEWRSPTPAVRGGN